MYKKALVSMNVVRCMVAFLVTSMLFLLLSIFSDATPMISAASDIQPQPAVPVALEPHEQSLDIAWNLEQFEDQADFSVFPTREVVATGYTAGYESTGKQPDHPQYGITYSGSIVRRDLYSTIAADTSVFPLGTILYIPSYGFGVVADIGGGIKGEHIDLYFETIEDVYDRWGKKRVQVYVIQQGDGHVTDDLLNELNSLEQKHTLPVIKHIPSQEEQQVGQKIYINANSN